MKGRVLVVDDDAALAEMLGIVLRGEGFEPTFVADGDKAMEVFRDSKPDRTGPIPTASVGADRVVLQWIGEFEP